jgi:hypothetical protein
VLSSEKKGAALEFAQTKYSPILSLRELGDGGEGVAHFPCYSLSLTVFKHSNYQLSALQRRFRLSERTDEALRRKAKSAFTLIPNKLVAFGQKALCASL